MAGARSTALRHTGSPHRANVRHHRMHRPSGQRREATSPAYSGSITHEHATSHTRRARRSPSFPSRKGPRSNKVRSRRHSYQSIRPIRPSRHRTRFVGLRSPWTTASGRQLVRMPSLMVSVIDRLRAGWSTEQIAGRLRRDAHGGYVCHETCLHGPYSEEGCKHRLARFLPSRRRRRRRRHGRKPREAKFPDVRSIHRRPEAVADRKEFGHWEADLMIFRREHGNANIATAIERKTRLVALYRNEDRRSRAVLGRMANLLGTLPANARRSVTFDRGLEFTAWRDLTKAAGIEVWLARSSAPAPKRRRRERQQTHPPMAAAGYAGRRPTPRLDGSPVPTPRHDTAKMPGYATPAEAFADEISRITHGRESCRNRS